MKILILVLMAVLAIGSTQNVINQVNLDGSLDGNKDGGATFTFFEKDKNYSVVIPGKDLQTLKLLFTIVQKLTQEIQADSKLKLPIDIWLDFAESGPFITMKIGYNTYNLSFADYRSVRKVLQLILNMHSDLLLRKMYEWRQLCTWV